MLPPCVTSSSPAPLVVFHGFHRAPPLATLPPCSAVSIASSSQRFHLAAGGPLDLYNDHHICTHFEMFIDEDKDQSFRIESKGFVYSKANLLSW
ncbi:uncharacterized protein [Primulina huaijiensis]|uniref:uncharacterized protein n=1 Tax=Primulina huaijiensis TaxID=1492673 RepID=UPI003CC71CA9